MKRFILKFIFPLFVQSICFGYDDIKFTDQDVKEMWDNRGEPVGEGSFGKIYIVDYKNKQYALKEMKHQDAIEEDIQGNEMLLSGIQKLDPKQSLYKNNIE